MTEQYIASPTNPYYQGSNALSWVYVQKPEGAAEMVRYDKFVQLLFKVEDFKSMALHAAVGVCGEAGELADAIKRHVTYGKEVDRKNLVEELGDLRFYIQAVQNLYEISELELLQANALKLQERYKSLAYSDEAAIAREDKAEIKIGVDLASGPDSTTITSMPWGLTKDQLPSEGKEDSVGKSDDPTLS